MKCEPFYPWVDTLWFISAHLLCILSFFAPEQWFGACDSLSPVALMFLSPYADHLVAGTPTCARIPPGPFRGKLPEAILRVFLGERVLKIATTK